MTAGFRTLSKDKKKLHKLLLRIVIESTRAIVRVAFFRFVVIAVVVLKTKTPKKFQRGFLIIFDGY